MNLVIIRENEEDLYAGIEHRQTPEVTQVLKPITRPGSENIIRYALEYSKVLHLLQALTENGFDVIKTENLYTFAQQPVFSMRQGE